MRFAGLAIALCVGAFAIFWHLADKSLIPDEAFHYYQITPPIPQVIDITAHADYHPPLFFIVFHYIDAALHWPASSYRYLTAVFGLLSIIATWALAGRWFGPVAATLSAVTVATEPLLVGEDHLFRMYGVVTALAITSWWLLVAAEGASGWRRRWLWLAYGAFAIAMPYTLYLAAFVVVAQGVYAIVRRGAALPALGWALASALALAPWSWAIRIQLPQGAFPGVAVHWWKVATGMLLFTPPQAWESPLFDAVVLVLGISIVVSGCCLGRRTALPFLFIPVFLQIVLSLALHKDLVVFRYLALSLPPFAIAAGAVSAWLLFESRIRVAGALLVIVLLTANLTALTNYLFDPYYQTTDWYAIEIALHGRAQPGDLYVFDQWGPYLILAGSPDVRGHDSYRISQSSPPQDAVRWIDAHPRSRVWYVENIVESWDPERTVWARLSQTRPSLFTLTQDHSAPANRVLLALYGPVAGGSH